MLAVGGCNDLFINENENILHWDEMIPKITFSQKYTDEVQFTRDIYQDNK